MWITLNTKKQKCWMLNVEIFKKKSEQTCSMRRNPKQLQSERQPKTKLQSKLHSDDRIARQRQVFVWLKKRRVFCVNNSSQFVWFWLTQQNCSVNELPNLWEIEIIVNFSETSVLFFNEEKLKHEFSNKFPNFFTQSLKS